MARREGGTSRGDGPRARDEPIARHTAKVHPDPALPRGRSKRTGRLRTEPGTSSHSVADQVWRLLLQCTMERVRQSSTILNDLGLTPGHMKALLMLEPGTQRPMGALAEHFGCDASTMTWLIDRLEERGLVERRNLPKDRRVKAIALTPRGIETKAELEGRLYEAPAEILALDGSLLAALETALEQLVLAGERHTSAHH